jgi:type VI secretion system protein VasI
VLVAAAAFVWLFSVLLFVVGVIFCLIRTHRRMGLVLVGGSFLVWFISMGMAATAPVPLVPLSNAPSTARQNASAPAPAPLERGASAASTPSSTSAAPDTPAAPEPSKGKWEGGAQDASAMDDTPTVAYTLDAENEISGWLARNRPTMIVRCRERKTEAYVTSGMSAQPELGEYQRHTVRLRFDDEQATSQLWSQSTNNEALFAPSGVALAKRLAKTKRLRLQFTPFNANAQVVEFETAGFDQVIDEIAKPCGWKP